MTRSQSTRPASRHKHGWAALVLVTLGLGACAPEVTRRPAALIPASTESRTTIEILKDVTISVGPGYSRTLKAGSTWVMVGRSQEGQVYKPVDGVFTVEGAQVHEAHLVLEGDRLVGFYLPVERAFSPSRDDSNLRLPIQRR